MMKKLLVSTIILACSAQLFGQNNSIEFDGLNDQILINNSATYNSANTLTVEAWINASVWKAGVHEGTIVSKDAGNTTGYTLRTGANGTLDFVVGTGSAWTSVSSTPVMPLNSWNHVAGVMDNGTLTIYINGVLSGSTASSPIGANTNNVLIGESAGFAGRVFDGKLDEVRIWDVARTQAEIQANMAVDLPANTPNLLAYFKMDVITGGNTTPNLVNTTDDGTLQNFSSPVVTQGYAIPTLDLSTVAIEAPDLITAFGDHSKVKATFKNLGADTITNFDVSYAINGGQHFIDNVTATILPGDTYDHVFSTILPQATGSFSLSIFAELLGDVNALNDETTIQYTQSQNTNQLEIPIFEGKQHSFGAAGQTNFAGITLPDDNLNYSKIIMEISVRCPGTGCDPWDQPAKISVTKNGQTYEIARYITPFGIGCGPWTVDVTDFKSLLRGYTEFTSYIQVWGQSGWLLDAKLIYETDAVTNPYQKLTQLWATDYWVYGDTNVSYDLPVQTVATNPDANEVVMRMTATGHGQGNTANAAEFSNFTHQISANGSIINNHNLWKADCATNSCANQLGTWLFNRAGWCPGEAVDPYNVNLTTIAAGNPNLTLDYVLQNYTNNLNTGYNSGGHTEPHYKIHAYVVERSDQYIALETFVDLAAMAITSPTNSTFTASSAVKVMLQNQGSTPMVNPVLKLRINGTETAVETVSQTIAPGNSYEYTFNYTHAFDVNATYDITVVIDMADDAVNNDVVSTIINGPLAIDEEAEFEISLYPNPSTGEFMIEGSNLNGKTQVRIFTLAGQEVYNETVLATGQIMINQPFVAGTYLVEIKMGDKMVRKKLTTL